MTLPLPELLTRTTGAPYGPVLDRLAGSAFRRRKRLLGTELEYVRVRGLEEVVRHAERFVAERIAPAARAEDGRQTPYRGHPAFIAQHATATCCRSCLEIWHSIPKDRALDGADVAWITGLLEAWLYRQLGQEPPVAPPPASPPVPSIVPVPPRRRNGLRLVTPERDDAAHILEECDGDGDVVRRWLQLELFG